MEAEMNVRVISLGWLLESDPTPAPASMTVQERQTPSTTGQSSYAARKERERVKLHVERLLAEFGCWQIL